MEQSNQVNLNLGSGTNRKQGYISIDKFVPGVDIGHNLTEPLPYADETVDNIYASHVIEHFSRAEFDKMSLDWVRVLKPGGHIEILCPDILKVCQKFVANPNDPFTMMQIYGQQGDEGQFHKNGFTSQILIDYFPTLTAEFLNPTDNTELHMRFTK